MSGYRFTPAGTTYDDEYSLTGYAACSMCVPHMIKSPTHELLTAGGQLLETDPKGISTVLSSSLTPQASQLTPVARTGTGGSVVYVQHDQQTIADYPVGGVASTPTYRYVYASYIDEPVVRKAAGTGGTIHYYHRNQQYSITAMTTSTGAVAERYAYTAYGQPTILNASGTVLTSSAVGNRYTYTGREWDETLGLHHFRARWMSPLAGRFLGRDPIGYLDGVSLYQSYLSLCWVDPTGNFRQGPQLPPILPPLLPQIPVTGYINGWQTYTEYELRNCTASSFGDSCIWTCDQWETGYIIAYDAFGRSITLASIFPPKRTTETFPAPQEACTCPTEYLASGGSTPRKRWSEYGPFIPFSVLPLPLNRGEVHLL